MHLYSLSSDKMNTYNVEEETVIEYTNDQEYRQCLRRVFHMTLRKNEHDLDEHSFDEINFDEEATTKAMDYVYEKTCHHPFFRKLYLLAASKMFSLDTGIGLAVVFSYDYFMLFHKCFLHYMRNPDEFDESHEVCQKMMDKIH